LEREYAVKMAFRIVVLGGYGNFGGRICRALATEKEVWLGVAGRDAVRAAGFVRELGAPAAACEPISIDHDAQHFSATLAARCPHLVIHTSGPFQRQSYHVAEATIAAGAHYIDLADGRAFVAGIGELDDAARSRRVLVTSGASTLPAVSSAVIARLAAGFERIEEIEIGIAPGQAVSRGKATIEAVLSYCGRPFAEWSRGRWRQVFGWQGLRRIHYPDLGWRWAARCDVPDLELLPARYRTLESVRFDASLELASAHFGLWTLAWLTRMKVVREPVTMAKAVLRMARRLDRFGSDVGSMRVIVAGRRISGMAGESAWHLTARKGDGPHIPCIPAIVIARKLARGEWVEPGARPCQGMMTLEEFSDATRDLAIRWRIVQK
jgi:saccharopine dehydrogenase-like NADP-dependent oxidoreductase